ncbi:DUF89 domain-containing protein [Coniophora puteana RWD-64-598 SS2]|uniref:Sugar phosphate phosphatase n=1 Tax=Coniophora puteana (strain RWD-64-598) TaxID=741705 RepID=A0A5M3MDJ8_CONPW|nr:DUF89 domain-containing protein [Coniophora puteana RWD-64-598 SS2]EIW76695.1 DUF89 domain-containing protein [Coniophora puteana RWD-64-598 SS2]
MTIEIQNSSEKAPQNITENINEGKKIIETISRLKYEMARDYPLEKVPEDGDMYVAEYNADLERLAQSSRNTWFTAPWLFAECHLYRLLRSYFNQTKHWRGFDPFFAQKNETFKNSGAAVFQIASTMDQIEKEKDILKNDPEKLQALYREMIQMCLWGNATDLSLLTHMSHEDIERLQTVGKEAQQARKEFILLDNQDEAWEHISKLKGGRCDIVLDNSGFELFTDFVLADFFVTYTPYFSKIIFHPKLMPWFVSDVNPADFDETIKSMEADAFFAHAPSLEAKENLARMVSRWKKYIEDGTFTLATRMRDSNEDFIQMTKYWTAPWPYWNMEAQGPKAWDWLSKSELVIFKGDLNYRKLTGDTQWPVSTPFKDAIGPLAGSFPILSLRTNKADVAVGVSEEVARALDEKGERWRVSGKYALVSFLGRD